MITACLNSRFLFLKYHDGPYFIAFGVVKIIKIHKMNAIWNINIYRYCIWSHLYSITSSNTENYHLVRFLFWVTICSTYSRMETWDLTEAQTEDAGFVSSCHLSSATWQLTRKKLSCELKCLWLSAQPCPRKLLPCSSIPEMDTRSRCRMKWKAASLRHPCIRALVWTRQVCTDINEVKYVMDS